MSFTTRLLGYFAALSGDADEAAQLPVMYDAQKRRAQMHPSFIALEWRLLVENHAATLREMLRNPEPNVANLELAVFQFLKVLDESGVSIDRTVNPQGAYGSSSRAATESSSDESA